MFLGTKEIRHARGRFGLITSVVGLITLLLIMLTGLTNGLGKENTSALENLGADRIIFHTPSGKPSFSDSQVSEEELKYWAQVPGVGEVEALGVAQTRMEAGNGEAEPIALFAREGISGVGVPAGVAEDLGVSSGDVVRLNGQELRVSDSTTDYGSYSHLPVAVVGIDTWAELYHSDAAGTVLLVRGELDNSAWEKAAAAAPSGDVGESSAATLKQAFGALPAYQAERSSLVSMQGFLYVISALVTISFLTVWTMQRSRELSVLRALGAPLPYLFKDALGQAAVVLGFGVLAGATLGTALGFLATRSPVPFDLSATAVLVPCMGIWVLGLAGAVVATRSINSLNPVSALGGVA